MEQKFLELAGLQGMKGDHGQPAAGTEQGLRGEKTARQFAELVVDVDAQRLEGAGRGIDPVLGPGDDPANQVGQLNGTGNRGLLPEIDDRLGDLA